MCTECPQNAKCCLGIRYSEVKTIILLSFGNVWTLLSSSFISWLHHYFQSLNGMCCLPQLLNCGVGEDSSESLGLQEIQPVHSEGDQPWDFFERNDAQAETPVLWPPHATSWLTGKDSDAGRDWGQEEKGTTEDEVAGWHHRLDGRESEWTPGVGDGEGGLACCDSWGRKESDTTEQLIWSDLIPSLERHLWAISLWETISSFHPSI